MINFWSLHTYWVVNGGLAIGFIVALIIKLPFFNKKLSQSQQLQLARIVFIATPCMFLLIPALIEHVFPNQSNPFQFHPILKSASDGLLKSKSIVVSEVSALQIQAHFISIAKLIELFILSGIIFCLMSYIKSLWHLKNLAKQAFCQRKINHIHLLFSEKITIPCCFSFIRMHFIIIPYAFLEKRQDLSLAIRHELQHLRQGDTKWLHFISIIKEICFWNPFIILWSRLFHELQEFACDEALVLRRQATRVHYAQCLIDTAKAELGISGCYQGALGIIGLSKKQRSILNRRVTMLFDYQKMENKKRWIIGIYTACFLSVGSVAYALNDISAGAPVAASEINILVEKSKLDVIVTPEVIAEINTIRSNQKAHTYVKASLTRMKAYQPYIEAQLKNNGMPNTLLALPFIESGYNQKAKSAMSATGIWQFIPSTAKNMGLTVTANHDDRLDTSLSTQAAIRYLKALHTQFHDWRLAVIAYEIGENQTEKLIEKTQSRDPWTLVRSPAAPKDLKKFFAMYEASIIIINQPKLALV